MKTLSNAEIQSISGASYSEDIMVAAATIYVATHIGSVASTLTGAAFAGAASLTGGISAMAPIATGLTVCGAIATPIAFFAAPVLAFEAIYPGVLEQKISPYLSL